MIALNFERVCDSLRAVSSLGLPSAGNPQEHWRKPRGGPRGLGGWSTRNTRRGRENSDLKKRLAKGRVWLSADIDFITQLADGAVPK